MILGLPGFTGWPNGRVVQELQAARLFTPEIAHVLVWVAYAVLVWLVVLVCAGQHKLLNYLGAAFVLACQDGATLGEAHAAALEDAPEFDLTPLLALLISGNAITFLSKKD